MKKLEDLKPGMNENFKISKQLRSDNQDVVGDKCVKDGSGNLSITTRPRRFRNNTMSIF